MPLPTRRLAEKLGVDGALLVAPYYNKPSQEGLFRHFKAIAAATSLPIMLYNIPGRCGVDILPETVERLAKELRQHCVDQGGKRQCGTRQ